MSSKSILISGAGIGGLCAAWWLSRSGYAVTIVEQAATLREDGYMLSVSGAGLRVIEEMGLLPQLRQAGLSMGRHLYLDARGRTIMQFNHGKLMAQLAHETVLRTDLADILYQSLNDAVSLQLGARISSLQQDEQGVDVQLNNGHAQRFDYVIGADGFRSATRRMVFGPDVGFCQHLGMQAAAYWIDANTQLEDDMVAIAEPRRMSMYYRLGDKGITALHIWKSDQATPVAQDSRKDQLSAQFAGSHARVTDAIASLPSTCSIYMDALMQVHLPDWSRGRVVLLGDAAHCLSLANGQGASMALAGACCLAQELAADSSPAALQRYQQSMRPGVHALQIRGRKAASLYLPDSAWSFRMRNWIMSAMPKSMLLNYFLKSAQEEIHLAEHIQLRQLSKQAA
ncbi:FAD-dependent monooxygenase [Undibacterium pigrum]|uniref:2-polyprenyl-6-methoxyphenol hydroxylase-like FAD-dependent oxidoreductase n=1 Tax=Undibacterium pigrum TaxID=401470 RepID=A0A318JE53_9BURK|nr:FAD-dependent monooxygenase [Undibacterium pigrum]PXX46806.1 2-polyprenyl-6-methoxyphenol hydroxylase-like FAD-dependent oxidoreductase [Undibacterium pigrum]